MSVQESRYKSIQKYRTFYKEKWDNIQNLTDFKEEKNLKSKGLAQWSYEHVYTYIYLLFFN